MGDHKHHKKFHKSASKVKAESAEEQAQRQAEEERHQNIIAAKRRAKRSSMNSEQRTADKRSLQIKNDQLRALMERTRQHIDRRKKMLQDMGPVKAKPKAAA